MSQSRSDSAKVAGATYTRAGQEYFEKRTLKRSAGIWGLWGLAVAAVISGDFSGWNFGIDFAGFGGMLIAFVILVAMYYGMIFSIGEMAAAMPHTGGAYSFARSAMGPWGGLITGAAETIEYVATTAVIVYFSASYADAITSELLGFSMPTWVWWIILYVVFIALNSAGAAISFKFAIVVSIISIGIILVFSAMAIFSGAFQWANLWDIAPDPGQTEFLPHGVLPILFALPFAMWFFLGIEELPLAAEESHDPVRDIPKAGFWARGTLIVTGLLVLFLNTGVIGAEATGVSAEPLLDGFRAIVGDQLAALLALFALVGLLASLQGIMFAYGRNMYSLSRAGYYPQFLSLTGKRQTPWVALTVGAVIGFIALVVLDTVAAAERGRRRGRGRDRAEHRGVGRGAGVPAADDLVHHPAPEVPGRAPPVRQPLGHHRRRHRRRHRGAHLRRLPAEPDVRARHHRDRHRLRGDPGRLRAVLPPPPRALARRGVRAVGRPHGDPQAEGYDAMESEVFGDKP